VVQSLYVNSPFRLDRGTELAYPSPMWPFRSHAPSTDRLDLAERRLEALESDLRSLRAELVAWEARAAKLTKELSRTLKSMAEVDRRERLRLQDLADQDEEVTEPAELDLVQRTLRFGKGG